MMKVEIDETDEPGWGMNGTVSRQIGSARYQTGAEATMQQRAEQADERGQHEAAVAGDPAWRHHRLGVGRQRLIGRHRLAGHGAEQQGSHHLARAAW